jgi:hypothetical protein
MFWWKEAARLLRIGNSLDLAGLPELVKIARKCPREDWMFKGIHSCSLLVSHIAFPLWSTPPQPPPRTEQINFPY